MPQPVPPYQDSRKGNNQTVKSFGYSYDKTFRQGQHLYGRAGGPPRLSICVRYTGSLELTRQIMGIPQSLLCQLTPVPCTQTPKGLCNTGNIHPFLPTCRCFLFSREKKKGGRKNTQHIRQTPGESTPETPHKLVHTNGQKHTHEHTGNIQHNYM